MEKSYQLDTDEENILCHLPFGYDYLLLGRIEYKNESDFRCTVNIKNIHNEHDVKEWIARLSECTLTTWRVQRTYPASGRCNVFKIAMKCQHNVNHNYKKSKNRKKNYLSKHTGCPSNMIVTIKRYLKNTKSKRLTSSQFQIDWPCFIDLNFVHNHPLNTSAVLRFRPLGNEIRDKIIALFKKGHSPSSALESIKLELFLESEIDYFDLAEDGFYIPTHSQVKYLFLQTFGFSGVKNSDFGQQSVEDLINNYNASNDLGSAKFGKVGDKVFVSICSPIMSRAHLLLPHGSQVAIMETTGTTEKKGFKIYFIVSPTPSGSIPLGCIISDADEMEVLNAALTCLKQCFPQSHSFYNQTFPLILMTDNDPNEQLLMKSHWPKSAMLLCQYRVLKSAWKWLNCYQNVPKSYREEVYYSFKSLIYSPNERELRKIYTDIVSKYRSSISKFVSYVNNMWLSRTLWSSAYRSNIPTGGDIESIFRIMKDCIFQRIRQYNLTQLVDFILANYESFMRRRLIEFTKGKVSKKLLFKYTPPMSIINPSTIVPSDADKDCYFVPSESDYSIKYMVDVKHCICSCEQGRLGKICKHLCGVVSQMKTSEVIDVPQSFGDMLYKIATGKESRQHSEEVCFPGTPPSPLEGSIKNESVPTAEKKLPGLTAKEQIQLLEFYKFINDGLKNNSESFAPAVKSMLKNFKHMKSETDFIKSMKSFGNKCRCSKGIKKKKTITDTNTKCKKRKIHVSESQYVHILPKIENECVINYDPLAL